MVNTDLDVLFVNPSMDWVYSQKQKIVMRVENDIPNQETPNIGIAYLMATCKMKGYKSKYVDMVMDSVSVEELLKIVNKQKPSLIGFTAFSVQIKAAGAIAAKIKNQTPDSRICVGGPHAQALPRETLEEFPAFDFVVCGEGETILPQILDCIGNINELSRIPGVVTRGKTDYSSVRIKEIDSIPFPAWEEFNLNNYLGTYPHRTKRELPMITGRGCPFLCTFCCNALGNEPRQRSVDSVLQEIERNIDEFGCESIAFLDESFNLSKKWLQEFCAELIRRGLNKKITWSCSMRVSGNSYEMFQLFRKAGCYYTFFGFESADESTLKRIKKGTKISQMRDSVKWAKQAGIVPVGAFIIGLEGSTEDEVFKAIELGKELDLYSITFPIAVPFPGTKLRELALKNKYGLRVMHNNWSDYGKQDPGVMESDDLTWTRRRELQKIAYSHHPKKKLDEYLMKLRNYNQI